MSRVIVEICVEGISSALAAGDGGADRIELCENLAVGGVTPSSGAIAVASRRLEIPVHVLIRPSGGDFLVTAAEVEAMKHDIETARGLGVSGVVLGVLRPDGLVDEEMTAELVQAARPMSVTFHRAFDATPDPIAALETLIALGVDRVLTSGRASSAREGAGLIGRLVSRANGRIAVLAGGRVAEADVPALIDVGVTEIHVGSAACRGGCTNADTVRRIVSAVRASASR